jgi:hypothetical protein
MKHDTIMHVFWYVWAFFKCTTKRPHYKDKCLFIGDNHTTNEILGQYPT